MGLTPIAHAMEPPGMQIPPPQLPEILDLDDMVAWTTAYPQEMGVGNTFTLSGGISNKMDIPLLVTVEPSVTTQEICSIKGFATQVKATEVRQHEYLLMPEGWEDDLGLYSGLLNDDTITYSVDYIGDAPGRCEMSILASVKAVDGLSLGIDEQIVSTLLREPLTTSVDLGGFDIDCQTGLVLKDEPLLAQTVASGDVDLTGTLGWLNRCKNNDYGILGVEYRKGDGDWEELDAGGKISDPGVDTVYDRVSLSAGTYEFRVTGALFDHWLSWACVWSIVAAVGVVAYALITPEPITKAVAVKFIIMYVLASGTALIACSESLINNDSYNVTVTVKDENDALMELPGLPELPDLPGIPNVHDLLNHPKR